jgi:hypothetical protein
VIPFSDFPLCKLDYKHLTNLIIEFVICYLLVLTCVLFFLLQVTVSDEGTPTLSSTTRVIVNVEDVNDHAPEFREKYLKALIPALADSSVFQVLILLQLPAREIYIIIFRQTLTIFQAPNLISRERTRLD